MQEEQISKDSSIILVKEKFNDDQFVSYISVVSASFKCGMSDRKWRFSEKK